MKDTDTDIVLTFGKFNGRTVEGIPTDYLRYLLKQDWFLDQHEDLAEAMEVELKYRDNWRCHFFGEAKE